MNRQEQIEVATSIYINGRLKNNVPPEEIEEIRLAYQAGAIEHQNPQNHWHDAQGDDLPDIDREVIVLRNNGQISFGHRPNPDGEVWKHPDGTLEHVYFKAYDKGGWNIPNVKWWCDINLPEERGEE